jgi:hypothetical protein
LFDIWEAAAPAIDFLAADLYFPNVVEWARKYARAGTTWGRGRSPPAYRS